MSRQQYMLVQTVILYCKHLLPTDHWELMLIPAAPNSDADLQLQPAPCMQKRHKTRVQLRVQLTLWALPRKKFTDSSLVFCYVSGSQMITSGESNFGIHLQGHIILLMSQEHLHSLTTMGGQHVRQRVVQRTKAPESRP